MNLIKTIELESAKLENRYRSKVMVNPDLNRQLVSFQANKVVPAYRWFKYKEAFSAALVRYVLNKTGVKIGCLLDPFAGVGTAIFTASSLGLDATGIELLPVGCEVMEVRKMLLSGITKALVNGLEGWLGREPWLRKADGTRYSPIPTLAITEDAYPRESERELSRYLEVVEEVGDKRLARLLKFAALCVLEEISYTRKDGQYLRWDYRAGRRQGRKPFSKGHIKAFRGAISEKLGEMYADLAGDQNLFSSEWTSNEPGEIRIIQGSVLSELPKLEISSFDVLITSPPYCNRYDYTRSYALELAFLGVGEEELKQLRQTMISCTVENREKDELEFLPANTYERGISAFSEQQLLQAVLRYLEDQKDGKLLNNTGIPRMVRNYFLEMSIVISECSRVLKRGTPMVMVNDNVKYAGVAIPVDLILSDIAANMGFDVEVIWVLPVPKGNSSQQMGRHGREELRKCVYVWRRL